jgi:hypothetical protein
MIDECTMEKLMELSESSEDAAKEILAYLEDRGIDALSELSYDEGHALLEIVTATCGQE